MHDIRLAEYDLRFQCMEAAGYDGTLIWKIKDYQRRKHDAVRGRTLSLYSQPFYTSRQAGLSLYLLYISFINVTTFYILILYFELKI